MRTELTKSIGKEIKRCREDRGLSVEDAAYQVSVALATWSAWERGDNITIARLEQLSDWWEFSIARFFPEVELYYSAERK